MKLLLLLISCFFISFANGQYNSHSYYISEYNEYTDDFDKGNMKRVPTYSVDILDDYIKIGGFKTKAIYKFDKILNLDNDKEDVTFTAKDGNGTEVIVNITIEDGKIKNIIVIYPKEQILGYILND